jgi:hypothetical protein
VFNFEVGSSGNKNERHTAIYRRYLANPRFMETCDYQEFDKINKKQQATMLATLTGVFIPVWALGTSKRFRTRNTKIWGCLMVAHITLVGVNSYFNNKLRNYMNFLDDKYFSQLPLDKIEAA